VTRSSPSASGAWPPPPRSTRRSQAPRATRCRRLSSPPPPGCGRRRGSRRTPGRGQAGPRRRAWTPRGRVGDVQHRSVGPRCAAVGRPVDDGRGVAAARCHDRHAGRAGRAGVEPPGAGSPGAFPHPRVGSGLVPDLMLVGEAQETEFRPEAPQRPSERVLRVMPGLSVTEVDYRPGSSPAHVSAGPASERFTSPGHRDHGRPRSYYALGSGP